MRSYSLFAPPNRLKYPQLSETDNHLLHEFSKVNLHEAAGIESMRTLNTKLISQRYIFNISAEALDLLKQALRQQGEVYFPRFYSTDPRLTRSSSSMAYGNHATEEELRALYKELIIAVQSESERREQPKQVPGR